MTTTRRVSTGGRTSLITAVITAVTAAVLAGLAACSPALDWRESLAEGSGLVASFPCRPDRHGRSVVLGGKTVQIDMLVCAAADATFAVSFFDVTDPAGIGPALGALREALLSNVQGPIQGTGPQLTPLQISGMTPNAQSQRLAVVGRKPDGTALHVQAAFFTRGLRVYQAAVIGAALPSDAADPFFAGLKFRE